MIFKSVIIYFFFKTVILLIKVYLKFILAIKAIKIAIIINNNLDYYKYSNISSYFCKFYYNIIIKKKI